MKNTAGWWLELTSYFMKTVASVVCNDDVIYEQLLTGVLGRITSLESDEMTRAVYIHTLGKYLLQVSIRALAASSVYLSKIPPKHPFLHEANFKGSHWMQLPPVCTFKKSRQSFLFIAKRISKGSHWVLMLHWLLLAKYWLSVKRGCSSMTPSPCLSMQLAVSCAYFFHFTQNFCFLLIPRGQRIVINRVYFLNRCETWNSKTTLWSKTFDFTYWGTFSTPNSKNFT